MEPRKGSGASYGPVADAFRRNFAERGEVGVSLGYMKPVQGLPFGGGGCAIPIATLTLIAAEGRIVVRSRLPLTPFENSPWLS